MTSKTPSSTVSLVNPGTSYSGNWKALAVPSIVGSKLELIVTGQVGTGIVRPELNLRTTKEKRPPNVIALDLTGIGDGPTENISYNQDITGSKYEIVLVYDTNNVIEAAIKIDEGQS